MSESIKFTITQSVRPLKLALLVPPNDSEAVLQAIQINTFLWGGVYNPIIPVHSRMPPNWKPYPSSKIPVREMLSGYIDAFDPDFVVNLGVPSEQLPSVGFRNVIAKEDILDPLKEEDAPGYGVGQFEIMGHLFEKELKYVPRYPPKIVLPIPAPSHSLFLNAVFGSFPSTVDKSLRSYLVEQFSAEEPRPTLTDFSSLLASEYLFPRRICSLFVERQQGQRWMYRNALFYLDAANIGDILDYWNLRACGWTVIPVPKQASETPSSLSRAHDFIQDHFLTDRRDPKIRYTATVLASRSVSAQEFESYARNLAGTDPNKGSEARFTSQYWYPRIWDEWARERDHAQCSQLHAGKREIEVSAENSGLTFKSLAPPFKDVFRRLGHPWFANAIELRTYDGTIPVAEVLPEANTDVANALAALPGRHEWRLSASGLVHLGRYDDWTLRLRVPTGQEVVSEWLKSQGWKVETSSAGRMMLQSFKQLGGKYWVSVLAQKGLLSLLKRMSDGKPVISSALWQNLRNLTGNKRTEDLSALLANLIKVGILKLGISVRCSTCSRTAWYALSGLDYTVQCTFCGETISLPTHNPKELQWAYRAVGPLCSPSDSEGAAVVLLTLRYLSLIQDLSTTPGFGIIAEKNNEKIEIDLFLFAKNHFGGRERTETMIVECKTENTFGRDDIAKMARLAGEFPGAMLVFATLRDELTPKEIRLLRPLANKGRRSWKTERPYNPVMVLTGTELTTFGIAHSAWEEKGGKHKDIAEALRGSTSLTQLCDATQQLYLGMNPRHEWLKERWEARMKRTRRKKSLAQLPPQTPKAKPNSEHET